jgi:hypothetical protein
MANENPNVTATDDPELAKSLGFDTHNDETGQWVKSPESDEDIQARVAGDELDSEQSDEERESLPEYVEGDGERESEGFGVVTGHATGTVTPGESVDEEGDDPESVDGDDDEQI